MPSRTKQLKNDVVNILTSSALLDDAIKVYPVSYPENSEQKDELFKDAQNSEASIYVAYAGRKYEEPVTKNYRVYEAVTLFIYSKVLSDDTDNPFDIEVLLDNVTDILSQKNYSLIEDALTSVKNKKSGLFEGVLILGKDEYYNPPIEE